MAALSGQHVRIPDRLGHARLDRIGRLDGDVDDLVVGELELGADAAAGNPARASRARQLCLE
jgi:hypothetical protein